MTEQRLKRLPGRQVENVLGPLAGRVMHAVWRQREATVASVREELEADTRRAHAYTTVMTIMGRLHERGLLERQRVGRSYLYRPAADEDRTMETLSARAVDQLLNRFGTSALRQFAERLQDVDPELRAQLIELAERSKSPDRPRPKRNR